MTITPEIPKKRGLSSLPGLRRFAPPAPVVATDTTADDEEFLPWAAPGSRLRVNDRAAASGFYAPAAVGAPSSTRQAAILNTALVAQPTGADGLVLGRDNLSQSAAAHDPATAYNAQPRRISSPNVVCLGDIGGGKSSNTKCNYVARPLTLRNRRVVVFDKKPEGDEGEYAPMARAYNSEPIRFRPDGTGSRMNPLDKHIIRGAGAKGQARVIRNIVQLADGDKPVSQWGREAIRLALQRTFAEFENRRRTATLADVLPHLGAVAEEDHQDLSAKARDRLHQAGVSVLFTLHDLLDEYGGMFDGDTSSDVDLAAKLTSFDLSALNEDSAAVPVVMSIGYQWLLGRLKSEPDSFTNIIYEEGWHMVAGPSAKLLQSSQKLSRALGISNVFVMHKGTDIPKDSIGMTMLQEAQTIHVYRQSRAEDARWCQKYFNFAPETADAIMNLDVGEQIFKYGSNPEIRLRHLRSEWERELTNTDTGMQAGQ
ncbi:MULTISPECIES: ATP/GTP-binding protein [unclassified Microbacterium]|uniref:ATP/GTP-binding protein n=1 Tax=unclassified Microbacterium TaxID=2609290 RepID=UPI000EAAA9D6|nr:MULTISPECIES: ATP/GTP-binding protein [unclassified Microbacterium]MBT2486937.1 ATP/GTP-binding protein [Microbacterium sp. ISL-108]RKN64339.1 ATP/GTP-binding protein [Microbacterium sp. CGR2]